MASGCRDGVEGNPEKRFNDSGRSKMDGMKMRTSRILIVVALVCGLAGTVWATDRKDLTAPEGYSIGPGDVLDISVWKEDALTKLLTVLPDGKIAFPLIGEVQAADRTVAQLKKEIETKLERFVPDPVLSVGVHQVNSLLIYVIGRVNQPGRFVLNTNINVLQALAMAGGLNSFAKRDEIKIFRSSQGKDQIFSFDYDEVSAGKNLQQNIALMRGDVVVAR
jgi:polysaccharide biosynthesis/export protein